MAQLRSPIIWRLILWFVLLSLIPIGIVVIFIQRNVRAAFIDASLADLRHSASVFSTSFMSAYSAGEPTELKTENEGENVFVLAPDGTYFAHPDPTKIGQPANADFNPIVLDQILASGDSGFEDRELGLLIATAHLPEKGLVAVVTTDSTNKVAPLTKLSRTITILLILSLIVTSLAGGAAILTVLNPLGGLTNAANEVGRGNFDVQIDDTNYEGELALLAHTFNTMTRQLKNLISGLEMRVAERTAEAESARNLSEKRAADLEAIGEISRIITGQQNLESLLPLVAVLVSDRFGFYHTGIFLLDDMNQFALLQAANSEGGRRMLNRGHKLEVGGNSLVGFATSTGQPRVALDVGQDAVFFNNPDLPDTHSEITLPLRAGDQILGALDVQSTVTDAFTPEDVNTLSTLADQVAIAIQNARSNQKSREALAQAEAATAQMSGQQWQQFLAAKQVEGFYFDGIDAKDLRPIDRHRPHSLAIPLTLRGARIGTFKLSASTPNRVWTDDEIAMAQAAAERTAIALESARLLQEAQKRATKERTIGEISAKLGSLVNIEHILQTTLHELGNTLPNTDIAIQFTPEKPETT